MRVDGVAFDGRFLKKVKLPRDGGESIELTLQPLPLGFHRQLKLRGISQPCPPRKVARGSDGRPMRDDDGLAVLMADIDDEKYLDAMEEYHQRVAVMVVWEALKADDRIEFDSDVPGDNGNWVEFVDSVWNEIQQAGWTAGDLIWLCDQVSSMSNLSGDHLRKSRADFFSKRA